MSIRDGACVFPDPRPPGCTVTRSNQACVHPHLPPPHQHSCFPFEGGRQTASRLAGGQPGREVWSPGGPLTGRRKLRKSFQPPICILALSVCHLCGPDKCFLSVSFLFEERRDASENLLDEQAVSVDLLVAWDSMSGLSLP